MSDIEEKNKRFLDLLLVSGMIDKKQVDDFKLLKESKLDLSKLSERFKRYIKENNNGILMKEDLDYIHTWVLKTCIDIDRIHNCGDFERFLDRFFILYEKTLLENNHINIKWINMALGNIVYGERYNIRFYTLKIEFIKCINRSTLVFTTICTKDSSEVYGYYFKNGKITKIGDVDWVGIDGDYDCDWVWVKDTKQIIDIILKGDYDILYLPSIQEKYIIDTIKKYDMSNSDCIDLLVLTSCMYLPVDEYLLKELDILGDSDVSLKELMISLVEAYRNGDVIREGDIIVEFLLKVFNLIKDIDKEDGKLKIKLISTMIDYLNENVKLYDTSKMWRDIIRSSNKDIDELITRFKILEIDDIESVKRKNKLEISLNMNNVKLDRRFDYVIYSNGVIKKCVDIGRALKNNRVYFVITQDKSGALERLRG